ncbi:MAG: SUMF1/EgtB/PvdO family nonheme iron enzyme [Chloroflexota bacterium]
MPETSALPSDQLASGVLESLSKAVQIILGASPDTAGEDVTAFEWCYVSAGTVTLEDASQREGTSGGHYSVAAFAIAKCPLTNAQYQRFLDDPDGFANPDWWRFSAEAARWRQDRPNPRPTAFGGANLPRTRVSWFDSMAFCAWLSAALKRAYPTSGRVRLPTEQGWQRAALGDSGWRYPWGNEFEDKRGNFARQVGRPTPVGSYPGGASPYGALDLVGNVWEWCLTGWGQETVDVHGYTYRVIKGGAWNVGNPDYLRPADRGAHPPRGRLNDCGFRCAFAFAPASTAAAR